MAMGVHGEQNDVRLLGLWRGDSLESNDRTGKCVTAEMVPERAGLPEFKGQRNLSKVAVVVRALRGFGAEIEGLLQGDILRRVSEGSY